MTEAQEQGALFKWSMQPNIRQLYPELKLLHHIKNETRGGAAQVVIDKKQGVKKGVPDLCLPVARGGYHGLYIEMKTEKGRLSPEQKWWLEELSGQRYRAVMCRGWREAAAELINYLEGKAQKRRKKGDEQ